MSREILFRGRKKGIKKWSYGFYIYDEDGQPWIFTGKNKQGFSNASEWERIPIVLETLGQYTGMTDGGKNKIFEGDLYKSDGGYTFEVVYLENEACFAGVPVDYPEAWVFLEDVADMERVGNKWDNPELLEEL